MAATMNEDRGAMRNLLELGEWSNSAGFYIAVGQQGLTTPGLETRSCDVRISGFIRVVQRTRGKRRGGLPGGSGSAYLGRLGRQA